MNKKYILLRDTNVTRLQRVNIKDHPEADMISIMKP